MITHCTFRDGVSGIPVEIVFVSKVAQGETGTPKHISTTEFMAMVQVAERQAIGKRRRIVYGIQLPQPFVSVYDSVSVAHG